MFEVRDCRVIEEFRIKQIDLLIVGGGLSGLAATWRLRAAGVNASLIEARSRFGGRVLTAISDHGADCDLGPSWFWPGQPLIANMLKYFGLSHYEQFADGDVLLQQSGGSVERSQGPSPMYGSRRIQGGIHRLVDAIVNQIDDSHRLLACQVTGLSVDKDVITVDVDAASGKFQVQTRQVALAIPPRLAAELTFSPALPVQVKQKLAEIPTWMAGHAKFFAVYESPFWRRQGLSGTAFSQRGPLAEVHDASSASTSHYSLFGFSGLDSASRARLGQTEFIKQATTQLVELFGNAASRPQAVFFQDWSTEKFTASPDDCVSPSHHPHYGLDLQLGDDWTGRLAFIATEAAFGNGGLIEGALESGLKFCRQVTGQDASFIDDSHSPNGASLN